MAPPSAPGVLAYWLSLTCSRVADYLILKWKPNHLKKYGFCIMTKPAKTSEKISAVNDDIRERAIKALQSERSTAAPAGIAKGKYPCKLSADIAISTYQGKDQGVRLIGQSDTGNIEFYASIDKSVKAKYKSLIESNGLFIGDPIQIEVYDLIDFDKKESKGLYCKVID